MLDNAGLIENRLKWFGIIIGQAGHVGHVGITLFLLCVFRNDGETTQPVELALGRKKKHFKHLDHDVTRNTQNKTTNISVLFLVSGGWDIYHWSKKHRLTLNLVELSVTAGTNIGVTAF